MDNPIDIPFVVLTVAVAAGLFLIKKQKYRAGISLIVLGAVILVGAALFYPNWYVEGWHWTRKLSKPVGAITGVTLLLLYRNFLQEWMRRVRRHIYRRAYRWVGKQWPSLRYRPHLDATRPTVDIRLVLAVVVTVAIVTLIFLLLYVTHAS